MTLSHAHPTARQPLTDRARRLLAQCRARLDTVLRARPVDAPRPAPTEEMIRALDEVLDCGQIRGVQYYPDPVPARDRGNDVAHLSGLYGVTSMPERLLAEMITLGLITRAGFVTERGREAVYDFHRDGEVVSDAAAEPAPASA